tara:strand:- start:1730 stop:2626 length:897 start_codon:yes stop_codon:yes gene_type:complete
MNSNELGSVDMWQISFALPESTSLRVFEEAFQDVVIGLSSFEIIGTSGWRVTVYTNGEPGHVDILNRLQAASAEVKIDLPEFKISLVEDKDWVAESQSLLTPINVDPYYIFGSHVKDTPPEGAVCVKIDAGQAFGTGHHETTRGCLWAIEALCADQPPLNPLDLGTGSGILAIALAKRFGINVTATDNDPIAVNVAVENARLNGVSEQIDLYVAEGIDVAGPLAKAPYDLIVANILAKPLIAMSSHITGALTVYGHIILSGILLGDSNDIIDSYLENELKLKRQITVGDWVALTFGRK